MKVDDSKQNPRWNAILQRRRDTSFFYAVKTTGIYCRVGCSSRTPKRANVLFFDSVREAEASGFRPCKRCQPAEPSISIGATLSTACLAMEKAGGPLPVSQLAELAGLSDSQFHRAFKKEFGMSPGQYGRRLREEKLREALRSGAGVTEAAYQVGYGSSGQFYAQAVKAMGMKPGEYREGGVSRRVDFTVCRCKLGWLSVARTAEGICAVELGDTPEELRARMKGRFPESRFQENGQGFEPWLEEILAGLDTPRSLNHLPLEFQGTVFQRQVWQALREIPLGRTMSYGELAGRLGKPNAYRAVARACAQNSLALLVPCHRVVGADGGLCGYRWGLERKDQLLKAEKAVADDILRED